MRKSKITLGIVAGLLSTFALAACDGPTFSGDGYVLSYTGSNNQEYHYTAEELFDSYLNTSGGVSKLFDSVYKVVVRNYFITNNDGIAAYPDIKRGADNDVAGVKSKAESNADDNGTKYEDEFQKQLDSYSVEDEDQLWQHFAYQRMTTEFEDQFYNSNIDFIRDAKKDDVANELKYSGYLEKMAPYHVRHILVKVSAAANALNNAEINESEAKKLSNVAVSLALGNETFGSLAQIYSEDTTSAEKFGDLGIMSRGTSFINEFKLGVYAYEAIHNATNADEAKLGLEISPDMIGDYNLAKGSSEIGTIPYEAFLKLEQYADVTKDNASYTVNDGKPFYFPRNVYFNKYFNRHDVSVVTPNSVAAGTFENPDFAGVYNATYAGMDGFQYVEGLNLDVNGDTIIDDNDKVLTTKDGKVILAVRGGSGGDSGYQGFHFIVVERSAFDNEANGVSLSEYYTTYYPGQVEYPVDGSSNPKPTYVNFLDQQVKDYKNRAESVEGEIKGFDANLKYYIYEKLALEQKIKFNENLTYVNAKGENVTIDLENTIDEWIDATRQKAIYEKRSAWEETWTSYVEFLEQQQQARVKDKLLSETCAIEYQDTTKGASWDKGGACYNDK
ncbi:MAG: peptidylprolyl isomerase [Bacilli bacterium]|jgi:parvulin-like peptidyl-prolyl isomerase